MESFHPIKFIKSFIEYPTNMFKVSCEFHLQVAKLILSHMFCSIAQYFLILAQVLYAFLNHFKISVPIHQILKKKNPNNDQAKNTSN